MGVSKLAERTPAKRGRPPKFGRSAQLVTLTLPDDVVVWLKQLHPDPAWAVVKLHERYGERPRRRRARPDAELVQLPGRRALIVVRPEPFRDLDGISLIPLQDGRAFLALAEKGGLAQLEVALLDKSEQPGLTLGERAHLRAIRNTIRRWRRSGIRFETRSILVALLSPTEGSAPRALGELKTGNHRGVAERAER